MASLLRPNRSVVGLWISACVLTGGVALGACGSSSGSRPASNRNGGARPASTGTRSTPAPGHAGRARNLERAVLRSGGPPPPTSATCAVATVAERHASPFGRTLLPVFSCLLTVGGEQARYAVQVLSDGCFVAERDRPGRAVYGCGVAHS